MYYVYPELEMGESRSALEQCRGAAGNSLTSKSPRLSSKCLPEMLDRHPLNLHSASSLLFTAVHIFVIHPIKEDYREFPTCRPVVVNSVLTRCLQLLAKQGARGPNHLYTMIRK